MRSRLLMISADTHAGPDPADYSAWLDPAYRDGAKDLIRYSNDLQKLVWVADPDEAASKVVDTRGALAREGWRGLWDPARRLAELEAEGFVGEVIFPGDVHTVGMYFSNMNKKCSAELRAAGVSAYNRWLAEFCGYAPQRMKGVVQVEPWPDLQACVDQVRWAAKQGFSIIALPRYPGMAANQPPLTSPLWEPFWRVCAESGMVLSSHIGHLRAQMSSLARMKTANLTVTGFPDEGADGQIPYDPGRRPLWQMILAGVFDRYPNLKLTFTELRTEWVGPTLAHLERRLDALDFAGRGGVKPKLRPTEYWRRNCAIAGQLRPFEVEHREQIGVDNLMFGNDYPHAEASWPNTREWLQIAMRGVPESEVRKILGENAARVYGFDLAALTPHADRVGLSIDDILGRHSVSDGLVRNLDWRAAFLSRHSRYDAAPIDELLDKDERAAGRRRQLSGV